MKQLCVVVLFASVAHADDTRPATISIPVPSGDFAEPTLPADVHRDAPADGWWNTKGACPKGTKLKHTKVNLGGQAWEGYECEGKGSPRPYTAWNDKKDYESWWRDADGKRHGGLLIRSFAYEDTELYLHGKKVGRATHRALSGNQDAFANYRDDQKHGLAHDALGGRTDGGYYIDGYREGTWFVWNVPGDIVRAQLSYKRGALDGEQRWWTRDGKLLARGSFVAGDGTWTALGTDGTRTETRCKGREMIESTARDRANKIVMHACGPAAAKGCVASGPVDGGERQNLGEIMCDMASVPPFKLW